MPFNSTLHPCHAVRAGFFADGMPIGAQIAGQTWTRPDGPARANLAPLSTGAHYFSLSAPATAGPLPWRS